MAIKQKDINIDEIKRLVNENNDQLAIFDFTGVLNFYEVEIKYNSEKTEIQDIILKDKLNPETEPLFKKNVKSLEFLFSQFYTKHEKDLILVIDHDKIFGVDSGLNLLTKFHKLSIWGLLGLIKEIL